MKNYQADDQNTTKIETPITPEIYMELEVSPKTKTSSLELSDECDKTDCVCDNVDSIKESLIEDLSVKNGFDNKDNLLAEDETTVNNFVNKPIKQFLEETGDLDEIPNTYKKDCEESLNDLLATPVTRSNNIVGRFSAKRKSQNSAITDLSQPSLKKISIRSKGEEMKEMN